MLVIPKIGCQTEFLHHLRLLTTHPQGHHQQGHPHLSHTVHSHDEINVLACDLQSEQGHLLCDLFFYFSLSCINGRNARIDCDYHKTVFPAKKGANR